jgi:hypothetical protein
MPVAALPNGTSLNFNGMSGAARITLFSGIDHRERQRLERYAKMWEFYEGKHWNFGRESGEPLVKLNYFRKFVDKHVEFLVGNGFVNEVPEVLEYHTKRFVDEVWEYNDKPRLSSNIALMGGITGDSFIVPTFSHPTELEKSVHPYSKGKVKFLLYGSEQVFPTVDPTDCSKVTSVRIVTILTDESASVDPTTGQKPYTKLTQTITPTVVMSQYEGKPPLTQTNPLGEINVVHIPNLSMPLSFYGMADGQDIIELQEELNEKATDISDIINYHAGPVTVITGAKGKALQKGPRAVWSGLPADAKVFTLGLEGDLSAATNYMDTIKKAMHEIGDVPEAILGQMQPISNTSGVAYHNQYGPIIGRRNRKAPLYAAGFEKLNYFAIRIGALQGLVRVPYDLCETCGGKVLEVDDGELTEWQWSDAQDNYVETPVKRKVCVHVNKVTLEPEKPEDMKLKIWREYGFGGEIRQVTLEEANEIAAGKTSFWDYATEQKDKMDAWKQEVDAVNERNAAKQQEYADQGVVGVTDVGADSESKAAALTLEPTPAPPMPYVQQLPMGEIEVPEEPIEVKYVEQLIHPKTGKVVKEVARTRKVVPTGCEDPRYLNPFKTTVTFENALPKDLHQDAMLYRNYQMMEWVDKEWVQERLPEVREDMKEINKRMKIVKTSGMPTSAANPMWPMARQTEPMTDLTPAPPAPGAEPGKRGNPEPPGGMNRPG